MTHPLPLPTADSPRALAIAHARRTCIDGIGTAGHAPIDPWLLRSWQRCLLAGHRPDQRVSFSTVTRASIQETQERHQALIGAARPVLARLSRAIADTRYFAILTDARGVVIDVGALPGGSGEAVRRARDIGRVGIDLSERAVGTTAIGAVLAEQAPVWLHRAEHFFDDTGIYSCAGAPLFGPQGDCIGMLDLTGVQVVERPELRHLAMLSARSIENALVRAQPHALLLRLNWPGCASGDDADGLLGLDADGRVVASNGTARQLLQQPPACGAAAQPCHASDLFALPVDMLWDAARRSDPIDVPLWSGLRLQAWARLADAGAPAPSPASPAAPPRLRDVETALIRQAVDEARGNVAEAARALGISRATVYRKLATRGR
ncbi:helix-turn-helix domain-containing protein [Variovorax sp. N23]|uniref:helix-turn-helix domain-containing protein n=1 Tax=Variovorax sp. N23 TaxID=2980555 RepID=UPI0021C60A39|nr:helix-turn-helix domain-containing protein [Variovorax sp. N23]MCU4117777.1 GAF domain-containing protein [Variovorax sp. N23]